MVFVLEFRLDSTWAAFDDASFPLFLIHGAWRRRWTGNDILLYDIFRNKVQCCVTHFSLESLCNSYNDRQKFLRICEWEVFSNFVHTHPCHSVWNRQSSPEAYASWTNMCNSTGRNKCTFYLWHFICRMNLSQAICSSPESVRFVEDTLHTKSLWLALLPPPPPPLPIFRIPIYTTNWERLHIDFPLSLLLGHIISTSPVSACKLFRRQNGNWVGFESSI